MIKKLHMYDRFARITGASGLFGLIGGIIGIVAGYVFATNSFSLYPENTLFNLLLLPVYLLLWVVITGIGGIIGAVVGMLLGTLVALISGKRSQSQVATAATLDQPQPRTAEPEQKISDDGASTLQPAQICVEREQGKTTKCPYCQSTIPDHMFQEGRNKIKCPFCAKTVTAAQLRPPQQ